MKKMVRLRSPQKKLPVFKNITVVDVAAEGKTVAKAGNLVIFVSNAVPGDIVDIQVTREKKSYCEGDVIHFHKYSDKRTEPVCEHFGICGGCTRQNITYEAQLYYKQKQVEDNIKRIGKIDLPPTLIIPSKTTEYYRNKLEFTFSNQRWLTDDEIKSSSCKDINSLGFHIPGRFDKVLDIKHCHLQKDPSNAIRLAVKEHAIKNNLSFFDIRRKDGFCRNLIIRTVPTPAYAGRSRFGGRRPGPSSNGGESQGPNSPSGEIMVILSFFYEDVKKREGLLNHLADKFPEITSLMYVINTKKNDSISDLEVHLFKGKDNIYEEMEGLKFRVGPKSFYQTNSEQAYELYKVARDFARLTGDEIVYDLYTGSGTIANFVARQAKKVIGIEFLSEAVEDAKINSEINGIANTSFYAGDIKDIFNDDFIKTNGRPDVIITDPPRAGMHKDVVTKILEVAPKRVIYVSCNPPTQARDIALMTHSASLRAGVKYKVVKIQPLDMFPHTPHVENVVLLEKLP